MAFARECEMQSPKQKLVVICTLPFISFDIFSLFPTKQIVNDLSTKMESMFQKSSSLILNTICVS